MPEMYTTANTQSPVSTAGSQPPVVVQDEPAIAEQRPMEMSAPIQPESVSLPAPAAVPVPPVAPIAPTPIPAPQMPQPVMQQPVTPQSVPAPVPVPPVVAAMPVPQPAPAQQLPAAQPLVIAEPFAQAPPVMLTPHQLAPFPVRPPVPAPLSDAPSRVSQLAEQPALVEQPAPDIGYSGSGAPANTAKDDPRMMMYSNNTQAVWQARSTTKFLHIFIIGFFLVLIGAILVFWLYLGRPTRIEDLPFTDTLLNSQ